jgi:hypothetical protein
VYYRIIVRIVRGAHENIGYNRVRANWAFEQGRECDTHSVVMPFNDSALHVGVIASTTNDVGGAVR